MSLRATLPLQALRQTGIRASCNLSPARGCFVTPRLTRRAAAAYRERLHNLAAEIATAEHEGDSARAARACVERDAITTHLRNAAGLGGRSRRLGDETERARKTVTARVRDALRRIERDHPPLAGHLRQALHTGTQCAYLTETPPRWHL